jgi:hypothetical protein
MAQMVIYPEEYDGNSFPEVCARCGEPATATKTTTLYWYPKYLLLFLVLCFPIFFLLCLLLNRRVNLTLPVCDKHSKKGFLRVFVFLLSAFFIIGSIGLFFDQTVNTLYYYSAGTLCSGPFFLFIIGIVLISLLTRMTFHPKYISDYETKIAGVSPKFAKIVNEIRYLKREFFFEIRDQK